MRKTTQDKMYDKVTALLPALPDADLISIVVTCNQLIQWRRAHKMSILRPQKRGERVAIETETREESPDVPA